MTVPTINDLHGEKQPVPASAAIRERDERLDSLKLLASRLAHDFNNFLAPLLGYLALIEEEAAPGSTTLQYALAMESSARRTENIVEEILLATRPMRRFRPEPVDFTELVENEIKKWAANLPPAVRVDVKQNLKPCALTLDKGQWQLVVQHLLSNARFALAGGGALSVTLSPQSLTQEQAVELGLGRHDVVVMRMQDNGVGMSEETLRRAFEPFFSTRPKGQAAGLGLALVHSVVRCHGGQVVLESAKDMGTTVKIWLPVSLDGEKPEKPASVVTATGPVVAPKRAPPMKLLVVDDDPMMLNITDEFLRQENFEVIVARNGREGLTVYQKCARDLALVITDIIMSEMNGVQMINEIRRINPRIPIILISGADEGTREEALLQLEPPRPRLIKKPFLLKELLEAIRQHLNDYSTSSLSKNP